MVMMQKMFIVYPGHDNKTREAKNFNSGLTKLMYCIFEKLSGFLLLRTFLVDSKSTMSKF